MANSPLHILHVIHNLDPDSGGPPEHLLQLSRGYSETGTQMEVLTLDAPDAPYLSRYPFPVHAMGPATSTFGYSRKAAAWLFANAGRYSGIVIDGLWQHAAMPARAAARKARVPYVVFPHGMLDPWFKEKYPLKHLKKQAFWLLAQYKVMRDAKAVVYTTEFERDLAQGVFWPFQETSAVVPLGTTRPVSDPEAQCAAFLAAFPALRGHRFLLFLSRIHEKKGCDLLIAAFGKLAAVYPDVDLVMAGPDPTGLKATLEQMAHAGGFANRVHWLGMLQGDVKWGAFRSAEAFVLPSHQENFGIAVAEAIACDLPVLISDKINIWNYVTEDGTGLVETDTEEGTVRLLQGWLAASPQQRAAMVAQTAPSFEKRFSMRTCALRLEALFH